MNEISLILGLISIIYGLIHIIIVPIIGPNLFIGLRYGYTMADKRVWTKSNRFLGYLASIQGIIFIIMSFFLSETLIIVVSFIFSNIIITLASLIKAIEYANMILGYLPRDEKDVKPIEPLKHSNFIKISMMALFLANLIMITSIYNTFNGEIAVHFELSGEPDAFQSITSFTVTALTVTSIILILFLAIGLIGLKHPMFLHSGVLTAKWGRDALFRLITYSFMITELIFLIAFGDIFFYNLYNNHIIPIYMLIIVLILLALMPFIIVILLRERND